MWSTTSGRAAPGRSRRSPSSPGRWRPTPCGCGPPRSHQQSAVDRELGAGDVVAVRRNEIDDRATDLLRRAEPLEGNLTQEPVAHLLRNALDHVRLDEAGRNRVHRNALAGELLGERLGERRDPGLRGGVVGLTEVADLADDRGDVHHAPPLLLEHLVDENLRAVEDAVEIDRE